jgi:hypothetical protein
MVRCSLLVLAVAGIPCVAAAAQVDSDREQAIVHFNAGNEAFSRGNTHEAYREYRTAWQLNRAFDIACNLGRAEAELGKLTESAQHLTYCLDNFSASPQPHVRGARQKYAELFATVKAQVSSLKLTVEPDGAEVRVDGEPVGTTPLARHVYLTPGTHRIEVRMPGYRDLRWDVPAAAGETRELSLRLERLSANMDEPAQDSYHPVEVVQGPELGNDAPVNPARGNAKRIVLVTGSALTLVSAGVGVGFYLHASQLDDEARALRKSIQQQAPGEPVQCGAGQPEACARLADTVDRRERARDISRVGFVAMGAFALGSVAAWLLWPTPPARSATTSTLRAELLDLELTAVPVVSEHGSGFMVIGAF